MLKGTQHEKVCYYHQDCKGKLISRIWGNTCHIRKLPGFGMYRTQRASIANQHESGTISLFEFLLFNSYFVASLREVVLWGSWTLQCGAAKTPALLNTNSSVLNAWSRFCGSPKTKREEDCFWRKGNKFPLVQVSPEWAWKASSCLLSCPSSTQRHTACSKFQFFSATSRPKTTWSPLRWISCRLRPANDLSLVT